jgi:hypothetical protein
MNASTPSNVGSPRLRMPTGSRSVIHLSTAEPPASEAENSKQPLAKARADYKALMYACERAAQALDREHAEGLDDMRPFLQDVSLLANRLGEVVTGSVGWVFPE